MAAGMTLVDTGVNDPATATPLVTAVVGQEYTAWVSAENTGDVDLDTKSSIRILRPDGTTAQYRGSFTQSVAVGETETYYSYTNTFDQVGTWRMRYYVHDAEDTSVIYIPDTTVDLIVVSATPTSPTNVISAVMPFMAFMMILGMMMPVMTDMFKGD